MNDGFALPPEATPSMASIMSLGCLAEAWAVTVRKAEERATRIGLLATLHDGVAQFIEEDELLAAQNIGDVISILHNTTHHAFDPEELLKVAFEHIGPMIMNTITKQRKKQEPAVMAELNFEEKNG